MVCKVFLVGEINNTEENTMNTTDRPAGVYVEIVRPGGVIHYRITIADGYTRRLLARDLDAELEAVGVTLAEDFRTIAPGVYFAEIA